jgi:putative membrane protein insertion efficiency factor
LKIKLVITWLLNLPNKLLIAFVRLYQKTLSPLLGERCRYWPSCSRYAVESLQTHNILKAIMLSSWRIVRCNPFSGGGLDPVPKKGKWLPEINTDGTEKV